MWYLYWNQVIEKAFSFPYTDDALVETLSASKNRRLRVSCATSVMLALTALAFASSCGAESNDSRYIVLAPGATWTYEFRYWEEGRFAMEQVGEHVQWIEGTVEWGGHQYYRLRSKTTGFQNAPDADQLIRVLEDSVRSVDTGQPSPEEVIRFPLPAVPGRAWSIAEGAETWHYILESSRPVDVPAGHFEDCFVKATTLESETSKFEMSLREEHCAGVGMVRMRTKAVHEYGVSNGEYTLLDFKPSG